MNDVVKLYYSVAIVLFFLSYFARLRFKNPINFGPMFIGCLFWPGYILYDFIAYLLRKR